MLPGHNRVLPADMCFGLRGAETARAIRSAGGEIMFTGSFTWVPRNEQALMSIETEPDFDLCLKAADSLTNRSPLHVAVRHGHQDRLQLVLVPAEYLHL